MVERRVYTEEFKREAVRLADERGNRAETARQLGISDSVLLRWKKRLTEAEQGEPGLPAFPVVFLSSLSEEKQIPVGAILTDNGREFCGRELQHPFALFLALNDIEHRRTKVRRPQTNGFVERFHRTVLDEWLTFYNEARPHLGYRNMGRRPLDTICLTRSACIWKEKKQAKCSLRSVKSTAATKTTLTQDKEVKKTVTGDSVDSLRGRAAFAVGIKTGVDGNGLKRRKAKRRVVFQNGACTAAAAFDFFNRYRPRVQVANHKLTLYHAPGRDGAEGVHVMRRVQGGGENGETERQNGYPNRRYCADTEQAVKKNTTSFSEIRSEKRPRPEWLGLTSCNLHQRKRNVA